jgi:hypothetical protein
MFANVSELQCVHLFNIDRHSLEQKWEFLIGPYPIIGIRT